MSSSGVREENTSEKRVIKGLILNEEQFIQSLRVFANTSTLSGLGSTGGEINNSPLEASGNYLTKSGDFMLGQFGNAFDGISATNIANDTLDVSKTTGITFPVVILQGEGLLDDDLVTITEGEDVFPFQELWIRTRVNIITIKNSDNINTPDGGDLVLPVGSLIKLVFDTFLGEWVIVAGNALFSGAGGEFFGPWTAAHDAGNQTLNKLAALEITDTAGNGHGLLQGLIATGVRLTLTAGEQFNIFDNITNIFQMDSTTGLQIFGKDLTMGAGGNIVAGGAVEGMTNIGHLDFIDNTATPAAALSIFSDGTDLFANTGGGTVNLSDIGDDKFLDGSFRIENTADNTKRLKFDLVGATASTIITLKSSHTADRTVTFPDAITLLAGLSVTAQSWTGLNDFVGQVSIRDTLQIIKSTDVTSTFKFNANLIPALTNRTFTIPNANGTIFITPAVQDLVMGSNDITSSAGNGMTSIGHLDFIDNVATPVAPLSIYSDGTFLIANTNSSVGNIFVTPAVENLDMNGNDIVDVDDLTMSNALSVLNMSDGDITNVADLTFSGISSDLDLNSGEIVNVRTLTMFGATAIIDMNGGNITAGGAGDGMTNIGHLDFIDNQATPAAALSIFSDGTDLFANTGGGTVNLSDIGPGSANTALSNLASVAINTALLPNADGVIDLGSATFAWDDVFAEKLRLETGGAITNTANMILADTLGMILNVPNNQQYTFRSNGDPILIIEEDEIRFGVSGSQHRINANNAAIQIVAENPGDTVEFLNGTAAANPSLVVENSMSTWRTTTTDIQAYALQIIQNNNTPADLRTIANIDGIAENSISIDTIYARISFSSQDITDGTEDGLLQLGIVSDGVLIAGIDIEGGTSGANGALIGFFGETPVAQQSVASDTLANLYTALRNLGLIV